MLSWLSRRTPEPVKMWAFWKYDIFPYVLSAEIIQQNTNGRVKVKGYDGPWFRPFYIATGRHGEDLHNTVQKLLKFSKEHQQAFKHTLGMIIEEELKKAGLPTSDLNITKVGFQSQAYKHLLKEALKTS